MLKMCAKYVKNMNTAGRKPKAENDDELPDVPILAPRKVRKTRIPAPEPTKTSGFAQSSARKTQERGAHGARGSTRG